MVCIAPVPSRDDELEKYVVNVVTPLAPQREEFPCRVGKIQ